MYEYKARLLRVVDGDTYDLEVDCGFKIGFKERFRLSGADTPEVYGSRASEEGRKASEFVENLLRAQPEWMTIKTVKDRKGKYGRYLVDIVIGNSEHGTPLDRPYMLSAYLVELGYATESDY